MRHLLLLVLLVLPASALAVPLQLAHHGQLLDSSGASITGQVTITFRLWDAETGGGEVWLESMPVDVVDGHYSALLNLDEAGRDLLRDEPALWLELEIDGETLSPRQPVAATPYALVADTAENLEGGTVNAQSISVNGSTVIDAAGTWSGPTGSIDWGALSGVPAELDDGDADALGGLSCVDGDRAVWDAASGLWDCGSSDVTLDRIDTSAASAGDLLAFDGLTLGWAPPGSSSGGCTLVERYEEAGAARVDCSGDVFLMRTWMEFQQVSAGTTSACGIRLDGTIACWGSLRFGFSAPPSGQFLDISVGDNFGCAVASGGSLQCWGQEQYGRTSPPSGTFVEVAVGDYHGCARTGSGTVQCWGRNDDGQGTDPSGAFDQIAAGGSTNCGVTSTGSASCWGSNSSGGATPPAGNFEQVSVAQGLGCGVQVGGSLACWGNNYDGQATPPSGTFVSVAAGQRHACGVTTAGAIECWGWPVQGQTALPALIYESVTADAINDGYTCAIVSGANRVVCRGENDYGQCNAP